MMRYFVFSYENYYPEGGWSDFRGAFDTIEQARAADIRLGMFGDEMPDVAHIIDTHTLETVEYFKDGKWHT